MLQKGLVAEKLPAEKPSFVETGLAPSQTAEQLLVSGSLWFNSNRRPQRLNRLLKNSLARAAVALSG